MLIKMCGIRDVETAEFAARAGCDFIGMVLTPGHRRSIDQRLAFEMTQAVIRAGSEPVGLFIGSTPQEIEEMCGRCGIRWVQTYGALPRRLLPSFRRLYTEYPSPSSVGFREGVDLLLVEGNRPGSGEVPENICVPKKKCSWLLAGGLTPENVYERMRRYQPQGVDVSSGIEREGVKHKELILEFIRQVRRYES